MQSANEGPKRAEFHLRLTEDQLATLKSKARIAGMSASEFVIACAVEGRTSFTFALPPTREQRGASKPEDSNRQRRWRTTNKTVVLKVRIDEQKNEELSRLAERAGISKAEYVRRAIENKPIVVIDRDLLAAMLGELNKQGGNLNQMARKMNLVAAIAWRDDVDGSAIDQLVYEIAADNERTRTSVNDAATAVRDLMLAARGRLGDEGQHGDD